MGCFHLRGQKEYNDWQQIVADNSKVDGAGVGGGGKGGRNSNKKFYTGFL